MNMAILRPPCPALLMKEKNLSIPFVLPSPFLTSSILQNQGFVFEDFDFKIYGICPKCNKKTKKRIENKK